jgi:signal transduction histidine kinase
VLVTVGVLLIGCSRQDRPAIAFTQVPVADRGGPDRMDTISGSVKGAKPGQHIVLYALANRWYVQPVVEAPFTSIQPDNTWKTRTHLGADYAALLVEPDYQPALQLGALPTPGHGVVAVAVRAGRLRIGLVILARLMSFGGYNSWWFRTSIVLIIALTVVAMHRLRMYELTRQLNARFQERLDERTRIAQELHDTLLQGFLSASMQVDVAEDQLPEDSPAKPLLRRALQLMSQVTEEGRNVIRGLRLPYADSDSIEAVFSMMGRELALGDAVKYSVVSDGNPRVLRAAIRDEMYRIGREALANAFKHAQANHVEVEVEYASSQFRLLVQDDGCGIDPAVLQAGRQNHWGLPGMRHRAERVGATLKLRSREGAGTEVELTVPATIAYEDQGRRGFFRWLHRD